MSDLYRKVCKNCGYQSDWFGGGSTAFLADEDPDSPGFQSPDQAFHIIKCGHRSSMSFFAVFGHTLTSATLAGRHITCVDHVCKSFGCVLEVQHFTAGVLCLGCLPQMIIAGATITLCPFFQGNIFWMSYAFFMLTITTEFFVHSALTIYLRIRFSERRKTILEKNRCPKCRDDRHAHPRRIRKRLMCPACNERTLKIKFAGVKT